MEESARYTNLEFKRKGGQGEMYKLVSHGIQVIVEAMRLNEITSRASVDTK